MWPGPQMRGRCVLPVGSAASGRGAHVRILVDGQLSEGVDSNKNVAGDAVAAAIILLVIVAHADVVEECRLV